MPVVPEVRGAEPEARRVRAGRPLAASGGPGLGALPCRTL